MAFDGKVNTEAVKKLEGQLRQLENREKRRKAKRRRVIQRARYYEDDVVDIEEQEQPEEETYLDRWEKQEFKWF